MPADFTSFMVWNPDPIAIRVGGLAIGWYSLFFLGIFVGGYPIWHRSMTRAGHDRVATSRIIVWALAGVVIGGRLVHCLVYEPDYFLANPLEILAVHKGGLASHGSTLTLVLAVWLYARSHGYAFVEMCDRFSVPAMLGATCVRLGNFFNSEIVGREWHGAWALRYPRFAAHNQASWEQANGALGWIAQPLPRHPSQLYETLGTMTILTILVIVDRRLGERRPRGLLVALMITLYFSFRFGVEFVKEAQRLARLEPDETLRVIHVVAESTLTMGQWLSVPFAMAGGAALVFAVRMKRPATVIPEWERREVGEEAG